MSELSEENIAPPYIDEVERLIGVRFYNDPFSGFGAFEPHVVNDVYSAGLELVTKARQRYDISADQPFSPTSEQRLAFRNEHALTINAIVDSMTEAAPVIKAIPIGAMPRATLRKELGFNETAFYALLNSLAPIFITFRIKAGTERGRLYLPADETARIRQVIEEMPAVRDLRAELRTTSARFAEALSINEIDIIKRRVGHRRRWKHFLSVAGATTIRSYFALDGLYSAADIASTAGVSQETVRLQAAWHGFDAHYVRRHSRDNVAAALVNYLDEGRAQVLIKELGIIVPAEYLSIEDYASLRGLASHSVQTIMRKHNISTHLFPSRSRNFLYLDGAAMHRLDCIIKPFEPKQGHWKTMREIMALVDASHDTVAKYLVDEFEDAAKMMKPYEGNGVAVPHYPPEFVAHVQQAIRAKGVDEGWRFLGELADITGLDITSLTDFIRREGITHKKVRNYEGYQSVAYVYEELRAVFHKFPKRFIPLQGITVTALAAYHGKTELGMIAKLRLAAKKLPSGKFATGRYRSGKRGRPAYYLKEELHAAGIDVPATPAFPAGERPYGPHGPSRPSPNQSNHWEPKTIMSLRTFISAEESLSAAQIAERLGITKKEIHQALAQMGKPLTNDASEQMYSGKLLTSICEQLFGIPLGHVQIAQELTNDQMECAYAFLRDNGHTAVYGRYSPAAIDFLIKNLSAIKTSRHT